MSQRTIAFDVEPSEWRYRLRLARYKAMAEAVAKYALERSGQLDLLDVGVGRGRSLRFIEGEGVAERFRFYGVDNSDRRLESVYRPSRWRLVKADVEAGLPYAADAFDVCLCEQVLEHLDRPAVVVAEIARVLRPGGLAILGVPTFPPGAAGLRQWAVQTLRRRFGIRRSHCQTFTCRSFVKLVEGGGLLSVVDRRGFRVLSGGPLAPLEDFAWWYRFNRRIGRAVPWLCTEVQVLSRKR